MWEIVALLREHGVAVRFLRSKNPGKVLYEDDFQIVVRDREHPITKGLPEMFTHSADELYSKLRGPAKNLAILATALADPAKGGTGRDEPMLMTIAYGKGRVFHTVLGHAGEQLKSVAFITTFQRGAEWAATGKVTQKVPADFPGPDQPSIRKFQANVKPSDHAMK